MVMFLLFKVGLGGAHVLGKQAAIECNIECKEIKANWKRYGRGAGPKPNQEMLGLNPDIVIAFHPNLDNSKGTKDMVNRAKQAGICIRVII
jgi:hypothetical protein